MLALSRSRFLVGAGAASALAGCTQSSLAPSVGMLANPSAAQRYRSQRDSLRTSASQFPKLDLTSRFTVVTKAEPSFPRMRPDGTMPPFMAASPDITCIDCPPPSLPKPSVTYVRKGLTTNGYSSLNYSETIYAGSAVLQVYVSGTPYSSSYKVEFIWTYGGKSYSTTVTGPTSQYPKNTVIAVNNAHLLYSTTGVRPELTFYGGGDVGGGDGGDNGSGGDATLSPPSGGDQGEVIGGDGGDGESVIAFNWTNCSGAVAEAAALNLLIYAAGAAAFAAVAPLDVLGIGEYLQAVIVGLVLTATSEVSAWAAKQCS